MVFKWDIIIYLGARQDARCDLTSYNPGVQMFFPRQARSFLGDKKILSAREQKASQHPGRARARQRRSKNIYSIIITECMHAFPKAGGGRTTEIDREGL